MRFRRIFATTPHALPGDLALLLLRVVIGTAYMFHGSTKIQHPFAWMGPDSAVPGFFQALAALSEFGGGLAWILGLLTPLASFGIACTMGYAIRYHAFVRGDPFVSSTGGAAFEPAAAYFCVALLLIAMGPGRVSLDRKVFGARDQA